MDIVLILFAILASKVFPWVVGSQFGAKKQDVMYAKIPDYHSLLSLDEFESFVVNQRMGEMYYALTRPPKYIPDVNYKSTITKIPGSSNYMESAFGESLGDNSECRRYNSLLTPMSGLDKTLFYRRNDTTSVQAMWSSCPSKYIWSMRCVNFVFSKKKCMLSDTDLGVLVHGDLHDAPIADIVEDLCRATGIRFGVGNYKWFFLFGENTLC